MAPFTGFTRDELIIAAADQYGGKICVDKIEEAMKRPTLPEAIQILIDDTMYWDWDGKCL